MSSPRRDPVTGKVTGMANPTLTFGPSVPTLMAGTGGPSLSYGSSVPKRSFTDILFGKGVSNWDMGTPVKRGYSVADRRREYVDTRNAAPKTPVNTVARDGASGFLNALSGFGAAALQSIGGTPEPTPTVQRVSYGNASAAGVPFDMKTMAIIAVAGIGIYYVASKS